ncbi:tektin-2 [Tribolium castaneum]|uniref:Tektin n=1 Tax=Tribolium castaneum TaxID=7070 RepID=D6WGQ5_TRICA|nr:PREDICTED: tektin-2 [Tribolium castaneum]EEZ99614.1 Tektin-2-like Protein [Tribolium castaneum]|eukprot:XP_967107.1 PREDICTED: tektin-2 [Tribolium castaneum]
MSVVTYEKPIQHIGLADWHAKQWQNQQTNDTRRTDAFNLRHESRQLRNETNIRTEWDTYHNNVRLADRITELDRWRDVLTCCLERVDKEILSLKDEKFSTERELDALGIPLGVVAECISMRDCRQGAELTYDDGDTELKRELCVVEGVKKLLIERCQAAWEKLNKLEEVRFKLNLELNDKTEAIEIDKDQLTLDKNCANISFKTDPLRIVKNSIPYEAWLEHSRFIKELADNELADTHKLREALFVVRERARNDLRAQRDRVDFTLRKRIYETQKARNELEWQQFKMREEMDKLLKEIKTLEDALLAKTDALKLCETRLENRAYRPGFELARDETETGLKNEVTQLRQTRNDLINKINCAKATYNALENQQVIIDTDLENKSHSLMTDIRCLDMRIRLRTGEFAGPGTDTDRNIQLTRMEQEIPPT